MGNQWVPKRNSPTLYILNKDKESLSRNRNIRNTKMMTKRPLSLINNSITYSLIFLGNGRSYRHKAGLYELLLALRTQSKIDKQLYNSLRLTIGVEK